MAKNEAPKVYTDSGVEITEDDLKSIQKKTLAHTALASLAAIGAGTLVWFARGFASGRIEINTVPTHTPTESE